MSSSQDLWEVRELPGGLSLELHAGDHPALVLAQGEEEVRIALADVKEVVVALTDAAELAELLAPYCGSPRWTGT